MELPVEVKIAQAKSDVMSVVALAQNRCGLSSGVMECVLESVLSKVREDAKAEAINALCHMAADKEGKKDGNADISA